MIELSEIKELKKIINDLKRENSRLKTDLFYEKERNMLLELKLNNYNPNYFEQERVTKKDVMKYTSKNSKIIPLPKD